MTVEKVRRRAKIDAKTRGYHLCPDPAQLEMLLEGLKENEERYGYHSCPCRLASGEFELDRDIICPCDYRDPDVEEYSSCYCGLYVGDEVYEGKKELAPIPERRPVEKQTKALGEASSESPRDPGVFNKHGSGRKLLYCRICGYTVFREEAPYICPICRGKREMFAEIPVKVSTMKRQRSVA